MSRSTDPERARRTPGHLPLSRTQAVAPASFTLVLPSFPLPTQQLPLDGSVQCSHQRPCTFGWVEGLAGGAW